MIFNPLVASFYFGLTQKVFLFLLGFFLFHGQSTGIGLKWCAPHVGGGGGEGGELPTKPLFIESRKEENSRATFNTGGAQAARSASFSYGLGRLHAWKNALAMSKLQLGFFMFMCRKTRPNSV